MAHCRGRKLWNGRAYEIVKLGKDVMLRPCSEDLAGQPELSGECAPPSDSDIVLSRAEFFRAVRLPYAVMYASAQDLTISGLLGLHDTAHMHFDWRKLFVGLSRATGYDCVIVY